MAKKRPKRCPHCGAMASVCQEERLLVWHVFCIYCDDPRAIQWAERNMAVAEWNKQVEIIKAALEAI